MIVVIAAAALLLGSCYGNWRWEATHGIDPVHGYEMPPDWTVHESRLNSTDCPGIELEWRRATGHYKKWRRLVTDPYTGQVIPDWTKGRAVHNAWLDRTWQIEAVAKRRGCYRANGNAENADIERVDEKLDIERDERRHGELIDAIRDSK